MPESRSQKSKRGKIRYHAYKFEMTADDHAATLSTLTGLSGMVVLSAYPSALYDENLMGWTKVEKATFADGARERVEILWRNPQAVEGAHQSMLDL